MTDKIRSAVLQAARDAEDFSRRNLNSTRHERFVMHPSLIYRYAPGSTSVASTREVRAWIRDEYRERSPRRVSGMLIAGWDPVWLLSSDRGKYAPIPHRVALADFPYERCADCGAEVHVSRLDDGLCTQCVIADRYTESTLR